MSATNGKGGWVPPAGGPLWPGPDLLVPIALDAFLIGEGNLATTFAATAPNYLGIEMDLPVAASPFSTQPPQTGVHLHWTLPLGLRHGSSTTGSDVSFPRAPNRWLLLRLFYRASAAAGSPPDVDSWIIQSDYYGADGTVPFPDPQNPDSVLNIGNKTSYASWTEGAAGTTQWLTAMGPGNQAFAATFDSSLNVFSALDVPPEEAGSITYLLYGWNANYPSDAMFGLSKDALNGWSTQDEWTSIMNGLGWNISDIDLAESDWEAWRQAHPKVQNAPGQDALNPEQLVLPAQTVLHGSLLNVQWRGVRNQNYPPNIPGTPNLAIGEAGNEALSAWLAQQVSGNNPQNARTIEHLMLAIGQGMANDLATNPVKVEDSLHSARFGNRDGGTVWVVQRPNDGAADDKNLGQQDVPLNPQQTQALTALAAAQLALESTANALTANTWELFAGYWKSIYVDPFDKNLVAKIKADIARLSDLITKGQATRAQQETARDDAKKALLTALGGSDYVLTTETAPRFCTGNDPVLLIAGAKRSTVHDAPSASGDDVLPTRVTGQTISALAVQYVPQDGAPLPVEQVTAQDLVAALAPLVGGLLPNDIPDLVGEGMLLDTTAAALIARLYFQKVGTTPTPAQLSALAATIAKQQSAAWNATLEPGLSAQALAEGSGFTGILPDKLSVAAWVQPWDPIFMDWSVQWFPTSSDPAHALDGWSLGDIDLEWDYTRNIGPSVGGFTGRTVIGEKLSDTFAAQLRAFTEDTASMAKLPIYEQQLLLAAVAQFPKMDIVSQSISGLGRQLFMRAMEIVGPIDDATIAKLIAQASSEIPLFGTVQNVPPFLPIKSGHFQVKDVWVVDAYGQILRGVPAGSQAALPIRSQSLVTEGSNRESYMQIAPRYASVTRSDFKLVSATDDSIPTNSSDATNPLAGWVVVNHLDYSLALFDGAGESRGSLQVLDGTTGSGARWDPTPGTQAAYGAAPSFPDSLHLQNFARGILEVETRKISALSTLISIIDATLWQVDAESIRSSGNLQLLVGTPLAMVRATLAMEQRGGPVFNQSWASTNEQDTKGYQNVLFSLRVGDVIFPGNGVIGYFLDDDYTKFYPVHGYSTATGALMRSLRAGVRNAPDALMKLATSALQAPQDSNPFIVPNALIALAADGTTKRLTILMDPRGCVPLISGYLPSKTLTLQPGPVDSALSTMAVNFRIGPVLTDPARIRMPLPAEIRGAWSWIERTGLTLWQETTPANETAASVTLSSTPPRLTLGWLKLSNAFGRNPRLKQGAD